MNDEEFKDRVRQRWGRHNSTKGRRIMGVFFVLIGGLLLARASGVYFPRWFFDWPMFLIGFGLFSGLRHNFRGIGWIVPILIGGIFLADRISPDLQLKPYLWPIAFIAIGLLFIFRPKRLHHRFGNGGSDGDGGDDSDRDFNDRPQNRFTPPVKTDWQQTTTDRNDFIDATAIFGGIKKNVLSKNFKGGDITTFMGGAEINLTQADCNGKVMIDCFNMFGGTKLIVPSDWDVQSDLTTVFGGVEDKRQPAQVNPAKILYLDGTCIFGGVEIKSF